MIIKSSCSQILVVKDRLYLEEVEEIILAEQGGNYVNS